MSQLLMHSSGFWKKHKYFDKIKITPKYTRYFYSKEEYLSYTNKIKKLLGNNKIDFSKITLSDLLSNEKDLLSKGFNFISNLLGNNKLIGSNKSDYEKAEDEYYSRKTSIEHNISQLNKDNKEIDEKINEKKNENYVSSKVKKEKEKTQKAHDFVEALFEAPIVSTVGIGVGGFIASMANVLVKEATEDTRVDKAKKKVDAAELEKYEKEKQEKLNKLNTEKQENKNRIERLNEELKEVEKNFSIASKVRHDFLNHMASQQNKSNPKSFDDLKKIHNTQITDNEQQALVNPYFDESREWKINCAYCTATYELRQRGYDVEADDYHNGDAKDEDANTIKEIYSWYESNEYEPQNAFEKAFGIKKKKDIEVHTYDAEGTFTQGKTNLLIRDIENSYPSGSRGQFCVEWHWLYGGGGHSVVWEKTKSGNVILRDCQTNKIYDTPSEINDFLSPAQNATYFRTDNAILTDEILKAVKNR